MMEIVARNPGLGALFAIISMMGDHRYQDKTRSLQSMIMRIGECGRYGQANNGLASYLCGQGGRSDMVLPLKRPKCGMGLSASENFGGGRDTCRNMQTVDINSEVFLFSDATNSKRCELLSRGEIVSLEVNNDGMKVISGWPIGQCLLAPLPLRIRYLSGTRQQHDTHTLNIHQKNIRVKKKKRPLK